MAPTRKDALKIILFLLLSLTNCVLTYFDSFQGRDLLSMIESTGIEIMASGQFTAQTRIQVLLDDIKDVYLELEDVAEVRRVRLEQCRNLRHFEIEAEQVGFAIG